MSPSEVVRQATPKVAWTAILMSVATVLVAALNAYGDDRAIQERLVNGQCQEYWLDTPDRQRAPTTVSP